MPSMHLNNCIFEKLIQTDKINYDPCFVKLTKEGNMSVVIILTGVI